MINRSKFRLLSSSSIPKVKNFINGIFEDSKASKWIPVINPATQETLCLVPQSTKEELERAEQSAIKAFQKWKDVPVLQRQRIFFKLQLIIRYHTE